MERLKLFPKLMLVASLVLLPACADADQEPAEADVEVVGTAPSEEQVEVEVEEAQEAVEAYTE